MNIILNKLAGTEALREMSIVPVVRYKSSCPLSNIVIDTQTLSYTRDSYEVIFSNINTLHLGGDRAFYVHVECCCLIHKS
jgi:hypothetical protein